MLGLYVFAVSGFLNFGYWTLLVGGLLVVLGETIASHKLDYRQQIVKVLAATSILYILATLNSLNQHFFTWDEFSHWGAQLKYLRIFGHLQDGGGYLLFQDYIPGISLLRSVGGLSHIDPEPGYYRINWYFIYVALLSVLPMGINDPRMLHRMVRYIAMLIMAFLAYTLFFQSLVATLYADPVLGVLLLSALTLVTRLPSGAERATKLIPILVALVLTKHTGILFAVTVTGMTLVHDVITGEGKRKSIILENGITVAAYAFIYLSWHIFVHINDLKNSVPLNAGKLLGVGGSGLFTGVIHSILEILKNNFPHAAFIPPIQIFGVHYVASCLGVAIAVVWAILLLLAFGIRSDERKKYVVYLCYLTVTFLLYIVFLAVIRAMSPWGADTHSFSRYVSTMIFPVAMTMVFLYLEGGKRPISILAALLIIGIPNLFLSPSYVNLFDAQGRVVPSVRLQAGSLARSVAEKVPGGSIAWYIYHDDGGMEYYLNRFSMMPIKLLPYRVNWNFFSSQALKNRMSERGDLASFISVAEQAQFLIVDKPDQEFWRRYGVLFPDRVHLVYKVVMGKRGVVRFVGQ